MVQVRSIKLLGLLLSILLLAAVSCISPQEQKLRESVKATDARCPITVGNAFVIRSVSYEHDVVTYNATVESQLVRLDLLKPKSQEIAQTLAGILAQSNNQAVADDLALCRQAGATVRFALSDGKDTLTIDLDPADACHNTAP